MNQQRLTKSHGMATSEKRNPMHFNLSVMSWINWDDFMYIFCQNDQSDAQFPDFLSCKPLPSSRRFHCRPTLNFKHTRRARSTESAGCDARVEETNQESHEESHAKCTIVMWHSNFPHEWQMSFIATFDQDRMTRMQVLCNTHIGNGTLKRFSGDCGHD